MDVFNRLSAVLFLSAIVSSVARSERASNLRRGRLGVTATQSTAVQGRSGAFDPTRPDFEIFNRTLAEVTGAIDDGASSAESYPLVTYTRVNGPGTFTFENFALIEPKLEAVDRFSCTAGGATVVGIMTVADDRHSRDRQRAVLRRFGDMSKQPVCTTVVYVIGTLGLDNNTMRTLQDEQGELGDLILLNITENMNEGKSFHWFRHAVDHFPSATYIGKSDVDAFVHPRNLAEQLSRLPNTELLYGFDCGINIRRSYLGTTKKAADMVPLWETGQGHMAGAFYLFSSDLINCSLDTAEDNKEGIEDALSSTWPLLAGCSHKFAADMFRFFDHEVRKKFKLNHWWQQIGMNPKPVLIHFLKERAATNALAFLPVFDADAAASITSHAFGILLKPFPAPNIHGRALLVGHADTFPEHAHTVWFFGRSGARHERQEDDKWDEVGEWLCASDDLCP